MKSRIFLHFIELLLAVFYVVIKWPFFEGSDYILNGAYSIAYIILFLFYCGMRILFSAMKHACNYEENNTISIKQLMIWQIPWIVFAFVIAYAFRESLGILASLLPIAVPNSIYLLWDFVQIKRT